MDEAIGNWNQRIDSIGLGLVKLMMSAFYRARLVW